MCGASCWGSWGCRCSVFGFGCSGRLSQHRTPNTRSGVTMTFERRGLVFTPRDLEGPAWVPLLAEAGLNLVGLHGHVDEVMAFIGSPAGQRFLEEAEAGGLAREYELHAMSWLLPRERFAEHPEWFRMDRHGERRPDANLCPAHPEALAAVAARAVELAERLPPSTERYYFWPDD